METIIKDNLDDLNKKIRDISQKYYEDKIKELNDKINDKSTKEEISNVINSFEDVEGELKKDTFVDKDLIEPIEETIQKNIKNYKDKIVLINEKESESVSIAESESIQESIKESESKSIAESIRQEELEKQTTEAYVEPTQPQTEAPTEAQTQPVTQPPTEAPTPAPTEPQTEAPNHGENWGSKNITSEEEIKKIAGKNYSNDIINGVEYYFAFPKELIDLSLKYDSWIHGGRCFIDENGNAVKGFYFMDIGGVLYDKCPNFPDELKYSWGVYCDGTIKEKNFRTSTFN